MVKKNITIIFSPTVLTALIVCILLYGGFITIHTRNKFQSMLPLHSIEIIEGYVVSNPVKTQSQNYYSVKIETTKVYSHIASCNSSGLVQVLIPTEIVEALYPGKLFSLSNEHKNNKSLIIEQGLLMHSHVQHINTDSEKEGNIDTELFIAKNIEGKGWISYFSKLRSIFRLEFKKLLYAWSDAGGLLLALLSGSREYTNPVLAEGFRSAGLSHILALSGMHLSLFSGLALSISTFFGGKKISSFFQFCAVIAFVWFAGLTPSLFRALVCSMIALMLTFCSLPGISGTSEVLFRFISPSYNIIRLIRVLSLSFLIHVCVFPQDIFSAGFMLSYAALLGISISEYTFKPIFTTFLPQILASPLSASIGAQLCTAPITIYLFNTIMPIGVIATIFVSPYALAFLVVGICGIIISIVFPFLLYPIGDIIQKVYIVLEYMIAWFSQFPPIYF